MVSDWIYIVAGVWLLACNGAAWLSLFYGYPGTWIILANSTLACLLLPEKEDGLGMSWLTVGILAVCCGFSEFVEYWSSLERRVLPTNRAPAIQTVLTATTVGGVVGALPGLMVPLVGLILSVGGSILGAALGAIIGSQWTMGFAPEEIHSPRSRLLMWIIRFAPSSLIGMLMLMLTFWSMYS